MISLVAGIFAASLLGSLHCVGMCGALMSIAITPGDELVQSSRAPQAAFHLGRLIVYAIFGALSGLLGSVVNDAVILSGVANGAAIIAGFAVAYFGVATLARQAGYNPPRLNLPKWWVSTVVGGMLRVARWAPVVRAGGAGLLVSLIPCGWLYTFVAVAGGSGGWHLGLLIMAVFWMGTLPALLTLGHYAQSLLGGARGVLPVVTAICLVGIGVWTVVSRVHGACTPRESAPFNRVVCNAP